MDGALVMLERARGLVLVALSLIPLGIVACGTSGIPGGAGGTFASGGAFGTGASPGDGGAGGTVGVVGGANAAGAGTGEGAAAGASGSGGALVSTRLPGTDAYDCTPPTGALPPLALTPVVEGLDFPSLVVHAPNDGRLFIVLQGGVILVHEYGALAPEPFLDISAKVASAEDDGGVDHGDRGLNGVAFHPGFAENGLFYVHYNAMNPDSPYPTGTTVIAEYQADPGDRNRADEFSEHVLLTIEQPNVDHNGGTIAFGVDGNLYIAMGDGDGGRGMAIDPGETGQDPSDLLGSVLRIGVAVTAGQAYVVPSGNLKDTNSAAAPEVWSYGLRNPFRMNFDACTSALYVGDVGYETTEEVDVELPLQGGRNYGWPVLEGATCIVESCDQTGLAMPVLTYQHPGPSPENPGTVIGGAVYRGDAIPALRGAYVYADHYLPYADHEIWATTIDPVTGTATAPIVLTDDLNPAENDLGITSIQNGPDGELYFTAYIAGAVFRLDPE